MHNQLTGDAVAPWAQGVYRRPRLSPLPAGVPFAIGGVGSGGRPRFELCER